MAYLVERHYNPTSAAMVPAYWQPEGAPHTMPCPSRQVAESMEADFEFEPEVSQLARGFGFDSDDDFNDYCDRMERDAENQE